MMKAGQKIPPSGVIYFTDPSPIDSKEALYLAIREKEGRLYDDSTVLQLPEVPSSHPLKKEWEVRKHSLQKLQAYFEKRGSGLKILDLGCGNGWMSNRLSSGTKHTVFAVDLNQKEMVQGARVFASNPKLIFCYADILDIRFTETDFDVIVIASAVQYFPDLPGLFSRLKELLKKNGEIHIIDSPFYKQKQLSKARERTKTYYAELGFAEMQHFYFHHEKRVIAGLKAKKNAAIVSTIMRKLTGRINSPFPWYIIRKN